MTKQQQELIYMAYLGICSLKRCEAKWGTSLQVKRSAALLKAMGDAFPFIAERVALSALRGSALPSTMPPCDLHESIYGLDCTKCGAHWISSEHFECALPSTHRSNLNLSRAAQESQ